MSLKYEIQHGNNDTPVGTVAIDKNGIKWQKDNIGG